MNKLTISRIAGICGILLTVVSLTTILVSSIMFQLDWYQNVLSQIGAGDDLTAKIFNYGLIIAGILGIVFAYGLFKVVDYAISKIGCILFLVASISVIGIGIFDMRYGGLHDLIALLFFGISPISIGVIGAGFIVKRRIKIGIATIIPAVVSGLFAIVTYVSLIAINEFIPVVSIAIWVFVISIKLIQSTISNKS